MFHLSSPIDHRNDHLVLRFGSSAGVVPSFRTAVGKNATLAESLGTDLGAAAISG